jgi:hypothetical protein
MGNPLGRYASDVHDGSVEVRLLAAPLRIWARAAEHHDELMREMALLALAPSNPALPTRLLELVELLGNRFGAAGQRPDDVRDTALAEGRDRLDLTFHVPSSTAVDARRMRDLLAEAEEYCRTDLLTLAQPPVQAAFARWYIEQFVEQTAGLPATPWPGPWDD